MEAIAQKVTDRVTATRYDVTLWNCYAVANASFWIVSIVCRCLDVFFPWLEKTQGKKSYFTQATWNHACRIAVLNIVCVAAATVPLGAKLFDPAAAVLAHHPLRLALASNF